MKLRIRGDSLRLRLTQGEVAALVERGRIEDSVAFGPETQLTYAVATRGAAGDQAVTASLAGHHLTVTAPAEVVRAWAANDEAVGLEGSQDAGSGRTLRVLVEKDFSCLKERPNEDDSDAFPNPKSTC